MAGLVPKGPVAIYDDDHYYMASVIARKRRAGDVEMVCTYTGRRETAAARSLVVVTARMPDDRLYTAITSDAARLGESSIRSVTRIGDALAPGTIAAAVYAGHRVGREMRDHGPEAGPCRRERIVPAVSAPEPLANHAREPDDVA
ncbi:MAG: hypothetical protein ACW96M_02445 [Candidatus Thorarchaeota archaeon]|jgi:dimethylamine/trimethylamine dehydrogenase